MDPSFDRRFTEAMDDDFNTAGAMSVLFDLARELNRARKESPEQAPALAAELKRLGGVLGLLQQEPSVFLKGGDGELPLSEAEIERGSPSVPRPSAPGISRVPMASATSWPRSASCSRIVAKEPLGLRAPGD